MAGIETLMGRLLGCEHLEQSVGGQLTRDKQLHSLTLLTKDDMCVEGVASCSTLKLKQGQSDLR